MKNQHAGSSFDSFLEEEGILEVVTAAAVKKAFVAQLEQQMKRKHKNKTAFRTAFGSPTTAQRLFSDSPSTELETIVRAADVVECDVIIALRPRKKNAHTTSRGKVAHQR